MDYLLDVGRKGVLGKASWRPPFFLGGSAYLVDPPSKLYSLGAFELTP